MSVQALTKQPKNRQEWMESLSQCQQKIFDLQHDLLEALPAGASLSYLSTLNAFRESLVKDLEQIDNFRYQLTLLDRQFGRQEPEEEDQLEQAMTEFFQSFQQENERFRNFIR